jgi:hypothetical protein
MAATDLLSLDEGKRALRIGENDSEDEDLLPVYISAVSEFMDQQIGPTVVRSVTSETHDGINRAATDYRRVIILRQRPVRSIAILTVNGSTTLSQTTDYYADPYSVHYTGEPLLLSGRIRRRYGSVWGVWEYGIGNVACSYSAGRVLATSNVPSRIKRAAGLVLENAWRDREIGVEELGEFTVPRTSFPTFAMPRAAAALLTKEIGQAETYGIGGD